MEKTQCLQQDIKECTYEIVILNTAVDQNVFNGERKTFANDSMFMSSDEIRECITSIKLKNWNGLLTLTLFH